MTEQDRGTGRRARAAALGRAIGLAALAAVVAVACAERSPAPAGGDDTVYLVPITGTIELGLAPFVERSLREARAAGAAAVVLDINTPGGRVDAAQRVVDAIEASDLPVYAFVNPRAFSAGAMIAMATDGIYMRPGAVIGAATPVTGEGDKAPEKIVSAMRSEMRGLAERHGLDPRIAEAMVDESVEVEGVVEAGKLLTLTTAEAERIGFAAAAEDLGTVLGRPSLDGVRVVESEVNWAEGVVRFITNPLITPLLLSIGFLGLLIEIKSPGLGLPGAAGAIALALFFGGHYLVGLAGWEELIILTAGLVLLAVEVFVVPGFGIFGILGIGGILGGIYLSLLGSLSTAVDYGQAGMVVSATVLLVLVSGWVILRTLPKNVRLRRSGILLGEDTGRDVGYLSAAVRSELVGMRGLALTDLRPAGVGRFGDERIDIVAEEGWVPSGSPIEIVRSEGYRHVVRVVETGSTAGAG